MTEQVAKLKKQWLWDGRRRPPFAVAPGPGQESVWDYPRPPRIEPVTARIEVRCGGEILADSGRAVRVLETSNPPTFYIPPSDVRLDRLLAEDGASLCEWKGHARYFSAQTAQGLVRTVGWSYPKPFAAFAPIRDWLAFYPARCGCRLGGVQVRPQSKPFYGGWVTDRLVGPFNCDPTVAQKR